MCAVLLFDKDFKVTMHCVWIPEQEKLLLLSIFEVLCLGLVGASVQRMACDSLESVLK